MSDSAHHDLKKEAFSTWATRYNRPKEFGDIEPPPRLLTLRGVPFPVNSDNPPCWTHEPQPIPKNMSRCLMIDDFMPINDIPGEIEIVSIDIVVRGSSPSIFDDDGNAGTQYGFLLGLKILLNQKYPKGIVLLITTGKSWANEDRTVEVKYVLRERHHPHEPERLSE